MRKSYFVFYVEATSLPAPALRILALIQQKLNPTAELYVRTFLPLSSIHIFKAGR